MSFEDKRNNTNRYPDNLEISGILFKQAEQRANVEKKKQDNLLGKIELLKLQLKDPSISASGRRNIRGWLELFTNQYNELKQKYERQ